MFKLSAHSDTIRVNAMTAIRTETRKGWKGDAEHARKVYRHAMREHLTECQGTSPATGQPYAVQGPLAPSMDRLADDSYQGCIESGQYTIHERCLNWAFNQTYSAAERLQIGYRIACWYARKTGQPLPKAPE